jgi:hypothetical protein
VKCLLRTISGLNEIDGDATVDDLSDPLDEWRRTPAAEEW